MKFKKNAIKMLALTLSKYTDVSDEILNHPDFIRAANKFVDIVQMIPEENKKSELRNIIREEIQNVLNESSDLIVLWADKVDNNLPKAIKKAKYKGKSSKAWSDQYKINASNGHGTVFFVEADNVNDAKQKITKVTEKNKIGKNVYIYRMDHSDVY